MTGIPVSFRLLSFILHLTFILIGTFFLPPSAGVQWNGIGTSFLGQHGVLAFGFLDFFPPYLMIKVVWCYMYMFILFSFSSNSISTF
jgi:hypothetical protein